MLLCSWKKNNFKSLIIIMYLEKNNIMSSKDFEGVLNMSSPEDALRVSDYFFSKLHLKNKGSWCLYNKAILWKTVP